jgi:hypothetical protein
MLMIVTMGMPAMVMIVLMIVIVVMVMAVCRAMMAVGMVAVGHAWPPSGGG